MFHWTYSSFTALSLLVAQYLLSGTEQTAGTDPKQNRWWCIYECGDPRKHKWARNHVQIYQFYFLDTLITVTLLLGYNGVFIAHICINLKAAKTVLCHRKQINTHRNVAELI